jgi:hypothetical protein
MEFRERREGAEIEALGLLTAGFSEFESAEAISSAERVREEKPGVYSERVELK